MRVRVKICGITHEEDAALCVAEGADALGFVVEYPLPVPWTLARERAAELIRAVPPFVSRVAVVGGEAGTILSICAAVHPDAVQLHGNENEDVVAEVARELSGSGVRVIKAVRIRVGGGGQPEPPEHWESVARRFLDLGADAILLDSTTDARPAGTGKPVDLQIARRVAVRAAPMILAGGLTPENVATRIAQVQPYAVDVISSLEDDRHRKRRERVRAFIGAVRGTERVDATTSSPTIADQAGERKASD